MSETKKTCGNCFLYDDGHCTFHDCPTNSNFMKCGNYVPVADITKGDVIKTYTNSQLARVFAQGCPPDVKKGSEACVYGKCRNCWLNYLNTEATDEEKEQYNASVHSV